MILVFIKKYVSYQRRKLKSLFNRRVSIGDVFSDRWENAKELGFGEGTSIYDGALVIGDVKVGKNTWIGPGVVLDGSGGLVIGDNCSISAGVQIYSHDSVEWALDGLSEMARERTVVGNNVYIGPNTVISKGVTIGSHVVIGTMSFVDKDIPSESKAYGIPVKTYNLERFTR